MGHGLLELGAVGLVAGLVTVAVLALTGWLALRAVRRRISRHRLPAGGLAVTWALAGGRWLAAQPWSAPHWWRVQARRRRLWVAVRAAERAVADARSVDAPVGTLPDLCRQLRAAADRADAQLRILARAPARSAREPEQVRTVLAAAAQIESAATLAVGESATSHTATLREDCTLEEQALAAGRERQRQLGLNLAP